MNNIDEMIADAKAEEEIALEMKKTKKPSFQPIAKNLVSIDVEEYVVLRQIEAEHKRLINLILDGCELGYNKEDLRIYDDDVVAYIRLIYPTAYEQKLAERIAADKAKED